MYNFFKMLQDAAEKIGSVSGVKVYTNDQYYDDYVEISGMTENGREFKLELSIGKKKGENDDRN